MKGLWPKRELSHEELLETYKNHYSARSRTEYLLMLARFRKRYGEGICDLVEELNYEMGKQSGEAEKPRFGTLLNKVVDFSVRPYCYKIYHCETSRKRIVYRVLECPFADVVKELELEDIGVHICPPWHVGYAEVYGFSFTMPKFLLKGDDYCEQIWESVNQEDEPGSQ